MKPKPLQKAIVYDDACPMCAWYTGQFVNAGLLESQHRIPFSQIKQCDIKLDLQKSRHEIPLVDLAGGQVIYGLDSLLTILAVRFPVLVCLVRFMPLYYFFKRLYAFISYNRKVIYPFRKRQNHSGSHFDCSPDFHIGYRWSFILWAVLSSYLLHSLFLPQEWHSGYSGMIGLGFSLIIIGCLRTGFQPMTDLLGQWSVSLLIGSMVGGILSFLPFLSFHFPLFSGFFVTIWQFYIRYRVLQRKGIQYEVMSH
jgi:hypothetical protein